MKSYKEFISKKSSSADLEEIVVDGILNINHEKLESLPTLPESIRKLSCSNNELTSLPPLPKNLKELSCRNNKLTNLPPLPKNLESLNCDSNQLERRFSRICMCCSCSIGLESGTFVAAVPRLVTKIASTAKRP